MADITITAANVVAGSDASTENGIAGATITAGQVIYLDSSTNKYGLADSDSATAGIRAPRGIALNGAAANQPLGVLRSGTITIGGTLTAGVAYYLSNTPGGICPVADVGAGEYSVLLGLATTAAILNVGIEASGVAL
jgi:hypothetical protein